VFTVIQLLISLFSTFKLLKSLKSKGTLTPAGIFNAFFNKEESRIQPIEGEREKNMISLPSSIETRQETISFEPEIQTYTIQPFNDANNTIESENRTWNETMNVSNLQEFNTSRVILQFSQVPVARPSRRKFISMRKPRTLHQNHSIFETENQLTLENNSNNTQHVSIPTQESQGSSLADTIAQYRKRRNYLQRSRIHQYNDDSLKIDL